MENFFIALYERASGDELNEPFSAFLGPDHFFVEIEL